MKNFSFKDFIDNERRLDQVTRFSAHTRVKDQSVSEHSFHTAFYAMMLADLEEKVFNNKKIDKEKLLKTALLHDLEECVTGDIIYNFKYSNKELTKEIKKISRNFLKDLIEKLPEEISAEYLALWDGSKDDKTIEGRIIEAADKLEGLTYVLNEISLGNISFKKTISVYLRHLSTLKLKSVDIIIKQIYPAGRKRS